MILNETITINPPPQTDQTGQIINPPALVLSVLDVTYYINPINKAASAMVRNIPQPVSLLNGTEFDEAGDISISLLESKLRAYLGDNPTAKLRSLFPRTMEEDPNGPGTILSNMISSMGIKSTPNCSCRRHAIEMNIKGPDWCEANMDTILAWLKEESSKRSLPFVEMVARMIVQRAIKTSRRLLKNNV
jgi:hypothetical protein